MSDGGGDIADALATLQAELSATQQLLTMLLVQHSLNLSRAHPTRAIDDLERDFGRIIAELRRRTTNAVEQRHFGLVETSLALQLRSARQLAASFAGTASDQPDP